MDGMSIWSLSEKTLNVSYVEALSYSPNSSIADIQYIKKEEIHDTADGGKIAYATRQISSRASSRIGKLAFELALKRQAERDANKLQQTSGSGYQGPSKVTIVHKSNVLSITDGLFRETVRSVQGTDARFDAVKLEEQIVDSMVYRMFREPE